MNLLLLEPDELQGDVVRLSERRARHLLQVLRVSAGSRVRVGVVGGAIGRADVLEIGAGAVTLRLTLGENQPPTGNGVRRILALPRPKALRRVLHSVASMGLSRLDLVNAWRVEKSYFQSPSLSPAELRRELLLGCEQGATTWLPGVELHPLLMPFLESLPPRGNELRLLAHPEAIEGIESVVPLSSEREVLAAVGPEGGWIDRELTSLEAAGFRRITLGQGVLRTEAAVTALLAQLELVRRLGRPGHASPR